MKDYVIGIDLGGTKISCAISDLDGKVIAQTTIPTLAQEGETAVLNRIIKSVDTVISESGVSASEIKAIGIGSPGPLDSKKGIIVTTPNLPFKNFNLVKPISEHFLIPAYLDNDANVAAIGEFMFGAGRGSENMVYVTVSTGVGGGAIINGK
ncbi:MAG: ROK family protein, partial [Clostridiaceae bacterium]